MRLSVVAEGQTELSFVNQILAKHLWQSHIDTTGVLIGRGEGRQGGGGVNVDRLARTMSGLYWSFDAVTSLVDFYGFERKGSATVEELEAKIRDRVHKNIRRDWDGRRVLPYVQRHEFEALLFTDVAAFSAIDVDEESVDRLQGVRSRFDTPEDINDHRDTAPSTRISQVVPSYDKVAQGALVAAEVGLEKMRTACPRFGAWLARLEALGSS